MSAAPGRAIIFSVCSTTLCTATTNAQGTATCSGLVSVAGSILALRYNAAFAGSPTLTPATAVGPLVQL